LKAIFVRVERPVNEPGKGHYWAVNFRQGEGNKRDRKRKDPSLCASSTRSRSDEEEDFSEELEEDHLSAVVGGRPIDGGSMASLFHKTFGLLIGHYSSQVVNSRWVCPKQVTMVRTPFPTWIHLGMKCKQALLNLWAFNFLAILESNDANVSVLANDLSNSNFTADARHPYSAIPVGVDEFINVNV
jgi:hypothetical protein